MDGKMFTVKGEYNEGRKIKKFMTNVSAHNEKFAREKACANFGSKHKITRNHINITNVEEMKA